MLAELRERLLEILRPLVERATALLMPYVVQARARYSKLDRRERLLVTVGAGFLALILAYEIIYLPITDFGTGVRDQIADRQREIAQVQGAVRTYLRLKARLADARNRTAPDSPDFSLFSIVETALTQSVGRDKLISVTPTADRKLSDQVVLHSVDLQLANLNLKQVVDALYSLRTVNIPIIVADLHIKRRQESSRLYDVDMTCTAVGKNG